MKKQNFQRTLTAGTLALCALLTLGVQSSGGFSPGAPARGVDASPPAPAAPAARKARLYETGVQFYAQGRLVEARRVFRRVLRENPNDVSARLALDRVEAELIENRLAGRS